MRCFKFNLNSIIKIEAFNKEHLIPPRKHVSRKVNTYILYFVTKGELPLKINGQQCILKAGDICLFEPGDIQEPLWDNECEYYFVHYYSSEIERLELGEEEFSRCSLQNQQNFANAPALGYERYNNFFTVIKEKTEVLNKDVFVGLSALFENNCFRFGEKDLDIYLSVSLGFADILLKIEKYSAETSINSYKTETKKYKLVSSIRQYIDMHFNENIDSCLIEQEFSFQYDYLNRLFRRFVGESIIKYRNSLRIEMAKFMLSSTEKEISEIAAETGFRDAYYFVRYFKKVVGCSPSRFRRTIKNESNI